MPRPPGDLTCGHCQKAFSQRFSLYQHIRDRGAGGCRSHQASYQAIDELAVHFSQLVLTHCPCPDLEARRRKRERLLASLTEPGTAYAVLRDAGKAVPDPPRAHILTALKRPWDKIVEAWRHELDRLIHQHKGPV